MHGSFEMGLKVLAFYHAAPRSGQLFARLKAGVFSVLWIAGFSLCACTAPEILPDDELQEIPLQGVDLATVQEVCYLPDFAPGRFPWNTGECLNFEEVFKNYQYVEARLDRARRQLDLRWFTQGREVARTRYQLR